MEPITLLSLIVFLPAVVALILALFAPATWHEGLLRRWPQPRWCSCSAFWGFLSWARRNSTSISTNFIAQSGKPIARISRVTGMDQGSFSIFGDLRGSNFRLDPYYMLDFRLDKTFNLYKGASISLSADFFNLLNSDAMTQTINIGTSDNFMLPDAIVPPRRIQFSLRMVF